MAASMTKTTIGLWVLAALLQVLIAIGLLTISYGDTFGLSQIAANGEEILRLHNQMYQRADAQTASGPQGNADLLRPLLAASNQAFHQLSDLLVWVGVALLISVLVQFGALIMLRRQRQSEPNHG